MRTKLSIPLMLVAALAACTPQADEPAPGSSDAATSSTRGEPFDLTGQWAVSRLDGETLDYRIPFTGTASGLTWQPACAGQGIRYRTVGDRIEFYQPAEGRPREVCDIGYPEPLPRVIDALEGTWEVARMASGGLLLTRGADRIELEMQPSSPGAADIALAGEWRVAGIDDEDFDEPYGIALSADGEEIWWEPRCAAQSVRYRIVDRRFIVVQDPPSPPPPPGAQLPPPPPVCTIGLPPKLSEVMQIINGADRIARTPTNGIRLSGNGRSLTLFSQ